MNNKTLSAVAVLTAALTVPAFEASSGHIQKRHARQSYGFRNSWGAGEERSAQSYTLGGAVCPGNARSFDCKIWPPPAYDDPDRRGTDGGP